MKSVMKFDPLSPPFSPPPNASQKASQQKQILGSEEDAEELAILCREVAPIAKVG